MKHFYARMTGKLLGDGTITKEEGKSPRFHFTHQATDKGWVDYCYQQLKPYLPLNPPVYRKVKDHRLTKGYSENYFVRSRVHPLTTKLRKIWYPNDTKIIPFSFIEKYLTEEALAWWYQDDGHLKIENNKVTKLILSTDSFTKEENERLIELLFQKYQLQFRRDRQNRILLYDRYQIFHFLFLVERWLQPAMHRKMNPYTKPKKLAQKPAIRLPKQIRLKAPTKDMNEALETLDDFFTNEKVDMHKVAKHFLPRTFPNIEKHHYQVRLTDANRKRLYTLQHYTGLTLSELATYCFTKKPSSDR